MDFFISWSHSDAIFCEYFEDCPMLISATPDNKYSLKKFKKFPNKIIIDSGALFYSKKQNYRLSTIFENQMYIVNQIPDNTEIKLVHLDEPLINRKSYSERYEAIEKTIFNGLEHFMLFSRINIPKNVKIMGVIQGFDLPSISYSVYELKKIGYKLFGIGSLINKGPKEQKKIIKYAADLVGPENLHVFGVTGIEMVEFMASIGIDSFDSSRPTMAAAFFQVFYSNPFRTYMIEDSKSSRTQPRIGQPLPCGCPICLIKSEDILNRSHRDFMKLRSLHNYFHFQTTINMIKADKGGI